MTTLLFLAALIVPEPMTDGHSALRGAISVTRTPERLVVRQKPSGLFRVAAIGSLLGILVTAGLFFDKLANAKTTTIRCTRATGTWEVVHDGRALPGAPALSDVAGVEVQARHEHRAGDFTYVNLVLNGGKRFTVTPQGAESAGAVASYRAAAETIRAFLQDPGAPSLEVSTAYRASVWEKIRAGLIFVGMSLIAFVIGLIYATQVATFDRAAATVVLERNQPLGARVVCELPLSRITAVVDRRPPGGQRELQLTVPGERPIVVATAGASSPVLDSIARELGDLFQRPVEVVTGP